MTADTQAFSGFAEFSDTTGEWSRMQFAIRSIINQMATATLVIVRAVRPDGDGFVVDVQPMVSQVDGAGNAVDHGVIHGLPVWRVQGGGSAVIVQPAAGDIGLAVFASTDISGVKRAKAPTTPGSARRFDWADGIYMGGALNAEATQTIRMDADGITMTSPTAVTIVAPTTEITGDLTNNGVPVGSDHTHTGVTTGGGTSGPPTP